LSPVGGLSPSVGVENRAIPVDREVPRHKLETLLLIRLMLLIDLVFPNLATAEALTVLESLSRLPLNMVKVVKSRGKEINKSGQKFKRHAGRVNR
jgi:hypothetical protein